MRLTWQTCAFLITFSTILVYLNSFQGVTVFDDSQYLFKPFMRSFRTSIVAPEIVTRPLIGLSLYLNYRISGTNLWSYHLFNLLVHLISALALFGIVKRTLQLERFRERYAKHANTFGLIIALIWAVHPLQTQAVTYIIQRCESLMGMFYLLTVYFSIRSLKAEKKTKWYIAAILACACGMLSKEVILTAPIIILFYDWLFLSSSFKELLARRWKFYIALSSTWLLLVITHLASPINKTAGFSVKTITPLQYLKVEFSVIVYYLKLVFYPVGLCLDYNWSKTATLSEMLPNAILVCVLLAIAIYGVLRRKALLFTLVWFFVILSLTSSIVPFDDPAFEHRMYLPMAGIIGFVVFALYKLAVTLRQHPSFRILDNPSVLKTVILALITAIATTFSLISIRRNMDYHSDLQMWSDVVRKSPQNARAWNNLGNIYLERGNYDQAIAYLSEAYHYNPAYPLALYNLGVAFTYQGDPEKATFFTLEALRIDPSYKNAHNTLGMLALSRNDLAEAKKQFLEVLEANPAHTSAHNNLAGILMMEKNFAEGEAHLQRAIQIDPQYADSYFNLGVLLLTSGRAAQAPPQFLEAVRLNPQKPQVYHYLGLAYEEINQVIDAVKAYQKELELRPDSPQTLNQLAYLLATSDDPDLRNPEVAIQLAQRASTLLNNQNPIPLNTLAKAYAEAGKFPEAIQSAQKAIDIAIKTSNKEVLTSATACLRLYQAGRTR